MALLRQIGIIIDHVIDVATLSINCQRWGLEPIDIDD